MTNPLHNCISKSPFITLEELDANNPAPELKYNLPQKSSFASFGNIILDVSSTVFNNKAKFIPPPPPIVTTTSVQLQVNTMSSANLPNNQPIIETPVSKKLTQLEKMEGREFALSDNLTDRVQDFYFKQDYLKPEERNRQLQLINETLQPIRGEERSKKWIIFRKRFGNFDEIPEVVPAPTTEAEANPMLFVIEEYRTTAFIGNYGAGKAVETITLLPSEKTTITVKTYREIITQKTKSDNVVDSFSQSSAHELENLVEDEQTLSERNAKNTDTSASLDLSTGGILKKIGLKANAKIDRSVKTEAVRESNTKNLNKALEKHIENSNSNRQVTITNTDTTTSKEGEETTTVRTLENPNPSRVLNFIFRQLLQEYVVITYLNDIKIAFSNGHPESARAVSIAQLDELLVDIIDNEADRTATKNKIHALYAQVKDYAGTDRPFLVKENEGIATKEYMRKGRNVSQTHTVGNYQAEVPGVILQIENHVLHTPTVVADALLGQGESLDCYGVAITELEVEKRQLENEKMKAEVEQMKRDSDQKTIQTYMTEIETKKIQKALEILDAITEPVAKADAFQKMFNPQQIIQNV